MWKCSHRPSHLSYLRAKHRSATSGLPLQDRIPRVGIQTDTDLAKWIQADPSGSKWITKVTSTKNSELQTATCWSELIRQVEHCHITQGRAASFFPSYEKMLSMRPEVPKHNLVKACSASAVSVGTAKQYWGLIKVRTLLQRPPAHVALSFKHECTFFNTTTAYCIRHNLYEVSN